jgi:hypothetical protein
MPTTVNSFVVLGAIEQKWLALGGTHGFLGAPLTNEQPTFDHTGRAQEFTGGVISWHPATGPQEVHGSILARWRAIGREQFGYPITDESGCPDGIGRFNHFRTLQVAGTPDCSIYWTPATNAHEVYGAIRVKWAELGWERSDLHYPIEAEHDQGGPGRSQSFQAGVITWNGSEGAAEHQVSGDTMVFDPGPVTSDLPLGGFVHVVVQRNGTVTITTHAHDSGFDNIDYTFSIILFTARGDAFSYQQTGHVEGTTAGLPFGTPQRNSDFTQTGNNPAVTAKWDDLVASGRLIVKLSGQDKLVGALNDLLAQAAQAAAGAGIKALVSLI